MLCGDEECRRCGVEVVGRKRKESESGVRGKKMEGGGMAQQLLSGSEKQKHKRRKGRVITCSALKCLVEPGGKLKVESAICVTVGHGIGRPISDQTPARRGGPRPREEKARDFRFQVLAAEK